MSFDTNMQSDFFCNECRYYEKLLAAKDAEITGLRQDFEACKAGAKLAEQVHRDYAIEKHKEIERLKECIDDALVLMADYDGYRTAEGLMLLVDEAAELLKTQKPMPKGDSK